MISYNPKSSNPTRVASVVHLTSFLARRNACVSFRVRCKMFPSFKQTSQNRHEMTRAGVVQKAPDTFRRGAYWTPVCLRGAYWTPPTDRHDTAMTCNDTHVFLEFQQKLVTPFDRHDTAMTRHDTHFWKQTWANQKKCAYYYEYLIIC